MLTSLSYRMASALIEWKKNDDWIGINSLFLKKKKKNYMRKSWIDFSFSIFFSIMNKRIFRIFIDVLQVLMKIHRSPVKPTTSNNSVWFIHQVWTSFWAQVQNNEWNNWKGFCFLNAFCTLRRQNFHIQPTNTITSSISDVTQSGEIYELLFIW